MEQQAQQKAAKPKLPKHRSPNYPLIGLEKALERARTIQDQARNHFAPINVVYQLWKYKTGLGDQTLAALKAFGLVEIKGEKDAALKTLGPTEKTCEEPKQIGEILKQASIFDMHKRKSG